jgi:hypothetical protein
MKKVHENLDQCRVAQFGVNPERTWIVLTRVAHATSPWLLRAYCLTDPKREFLSLICNHDADTIRWELENLLRDLGEPVEAMIFDHPEDAPAAWLSDQGIHCIIRASAAQADESEA